MITNSGRTADFILESDKAKDPATRPTFVFRFLASRDTRKAKALTIEAATGAKTDEDVEGLLKQAVALGLIGWRNIDEPFSIDNLASILSDDELWEMATLFPVRLYEAEIETKRAERKEREAASVPPPPEIHELEALRGAPAVPPPAGPSL